MLILKVSWYKFKKVYALWGDDLRVMIFTKPADIHFNVLSIICIVFFTVEISMACYAKPGYLWSFFFYLDVISTLTLFMDLTWVGDVISGSKK